LPERQRKRPVYAPIEDRLVTLLVRKPCPGPQWDSIQLSVVRAMMETHGSRTRTPSRLDRFVWPEERRVEARYLGASVGQAVALVRLSGEPPTESVEVVREVSGVLGRRPSLGFGEPHLGRLGALVCRFPSASTMRSLIGFARSSTVAAFAPASSAGSGSTSSVITTT
jgi:hypothetical protein